MIKARLSRPDAFDQSLSSSILPVAKDRRQRTGLKSAYQSSVSSATNVDHETGAKSSELLPQACIAAHDEQVGSSRSKHAQIRDVLRQYERGSLKEAEAVEELLKILH
jgi:hypothetical protein